MSTVRKSKRKKGDKFAPGAKPGRARYSFGQFKRIKIGSVAVYAAVKPI